MTLDNREAFPDEQAYIAHRQHLASLQRAERLKAAAPSTPSVKRRKIKPRKGETYWQARYRALTRSEYALLLLRHKKRYWRDHAFVREYYNNYARAWRAKNPERARAIDRRHREAHREERNLQRRVYYWDHWKQERERNRAYQRAHRKQLTDYMRTWRQGHRKHFTDAVRNWRQEHRQHYREYCRNRYRIPEVREKILARGRIYRAVYREQIAERKRRYNETHHEERLAYFRQYNRFFRDKSASKTPEARLRHAMNERERRARNGAMSNTTYRTRDQIQHEARVLEDAVIEARMAGFAWKEIAELLGRKEKACVKAYRRAMKRQQQESEDAA